MVKPIIKIVSLFLFLLFQSTSYSQVFQDIEWYDVDSLKQRLTDQEGTEKVNTLNHISASLSFEDYALSKQYADDALLLAKKLNYQEGVAAAIRNFGYIQFYQGNYPHALNYYWESLNIYRSLGKEAIAGRILEDIATSHFCAKNVQKVFEVIHEAMRTFTSKDEHGNPVGNVRDISTLNIRMGLVYRTIGKSDTALSIYLNYIKTGEKHHFEITDMLVMTGLVGLCYFETGNSDSALYYFHKALEFPEVNPSIKAMNSDHKRRMGGIFFAIGQPDSAIFYLTAAYDWLSRSGYLMQSQKAAMQLGEVYSSINDATKAGFFFNRSEALLDEMIEKNSFYRYDSLKYTVSWGRDLYLPFTRQVMRDFIYDLAVQLYDKMYRFYLARNELRLATRYMLKYTQARDTVMEFGRNREFIEIQTKFETEQKDKEILSLSQDNVLKKAELEQSRWIAVGLAGVAILIVFMAIILIRQNRLKNSQQTLLFQQRLLRTQMNPHFLFNSLASIQNFIIKEKPEMASDYLSRFSKLVRQILNNSVEEWVPLEDEVESIENYLELQKVRYRNMFEYTIEVNEAIDQETTLVPPMLAQPFIENSIEHGFKHKEGKGYMKITLKLNGKLIRFELEDDGVGRNKALQLLKSQDKDHRSMSTEITRQRLKVLSKKTRQKINLSIVDLKDELGEAAGTKVVFDIPYKN
ncbi:MAG: histidine kinase [Bacteroidales bacterium]